MFSVVSCWGMVEINNKRFKGKTKNYSNTEFKGSRKVKTKNIEYRITNNECRTGNREQEKENNYGLFWRIFLTVLILVTNIEIS